MPTVREATFDLLRALGMTTVFGNPGSTELPFLRDFPPDFAYVLGLQESVVLGMADGYAQARRRAALVNVHTAAGLGNAMGGIVGAYHNRTPLVVAAGQQDRRQLALEPFLKGQLVELAHPYVKWSHEPARAEDVPAALARAYYTAMQEPWGPVFVSIPMDDWDAQCAPYPVTEREVVPRVAPDPAAIARAAALLRESGRPAIVAGAGVDRSDGWDAVVALAEKTRAAVWANPLGGRAGFPQDHPLFRGHLAPAQAVLSRQLADHDLVLVLGAPAFLYYPYVPGPTVAPGTRLIQVTDNPDEAAYAATGLSIVGNVALAAQALVDLVPATERRAPPPLPTYAPPEPSEPISVDYLMHTLAALLPPEAIVVDESISSRPKLLRHVRVKRPGGYYIGVSGGLGFALPAAVGVKLGEPERPVVCVTGDGSSLYAIQALWSAAQYHVPVTYVVVDNGQYAILKAFGDSLGLGKGLPGLDLPGLDIAGLARSLGCEAETVKHPADLAAALRRGLDATGPYLVDVMVDRAVAPLLG